MLIELELSVARVAPEKRYRHRLLLRYDAQLGEVVMRIVIFSGGGSHVVNAPDGTLSWHIMDSDGKESVRDVKLYEYREISTHKFAYIASFREASKGEITEAILKHGYDV